MSINISCGRFAKVVRTDGVPLPELLKECANALLVSVLGLSSPADFFTSAEKTDSKKALPLNAKLASWDFA